MIEAIERKAGFAIKTIVDAQKLSDLILISGLNISTHTLARFFGLMKPERKHYRYTLDLIAEFLGYRNFDECEHYYLNKEDFSNILLANNSFPLQEMELYLVTDDLDEIESLLKTYTVEETEPFEFLISRKIGYHVRNSTKKSELLTLLSNYELGRKIYFETYVDEDDQQQFYSKALKELYLPKVKDFGKQLFAKTFFDVQQIYSNNAAEVNLNIFNIDRKSLTHPHELSRFWEYYFLIKIPKGKKKDLYSKLDLLLDEADQLYDFYRCWMYSRTIRAFAYHGQLDLLKSHPVFVESCIKTIQKGDVSTNSIALLFIQSFLIRYSDTKAQLPGIITMPFHQFTNESQNKVLLENLCKYYLHQEVLGDKHRTKLIEAGKYLNKNWIKGFL
jgi:hypothetical protein